MKQRNEAVDGFIDKMDKKNQTKEEDNDEEDDFDKFESQHKQKTLNNTKNKEIEDDQVQYQYQDKEEKEEYKPIKSINDHHNDEENKMNYEQNDTDDNQGDYKKYDSLKNSIQKSSITKSPSIRPPGYLYEKENSNIMKQQYIRKETNKYFRQMSSNNGIDYTKEKGPTTTINNEPQEITKPSQVETEEQQIQYQTAPNTLLTPLTQLSPQQLHKMKMKEDKMLRQLTNPRNPYSNQWPNYLLNIRFGSELRVNGFLNGVPQFKIAKLKAKPFLPNISYYQYNKQMLTSRQLQKEEEKKQRIQFPLIKQYFQRNNQS